MEVDEDSAIPHPHVGDVGMVGADGEACSPHAKMAEDEGANPQNRSPPQAQTNYWAEEERVRDMLAKCFDIGILPVGWDIGELSEEGTKAHFTLNPSLDEIKVKWLKERTVTVIFHKGSKNLSKKVKEEVARAYEHIWMGEEHFDPSITRGRVCIESSNVLSYIAKDTRVLEWMIQEGDIRVALRGSRRWYNIAFKPWLTKKEIQDLRKEATNNYFFIRILDVPSDAYCYLESAAELSIGKVIKVYLSERDARTPQLINVRIDIAIETLPRLKETLSFTTFQGKIIELKVANAQTPWCSRCRRYYHLADDCPRQRRRRDPSPTPSPNSSGAPSFNSAHPSRPSPRTSPSNRRNSRREATPTPSRNESPTTSVGRGRPVDSHGSGSRRHSENQQRSRNTAKSSSRISNESGRPTKQPSYSRKLGPRGSRGPQGIAPRDGMVARDNPNFSLAYPTRAEEGIQSRAQGGITKEATQPRPRDQEDTRASTSKSQSLSGSKDECRQETTPTKQRRRLGEDMREYRIEEQVEGEHSSASVARKDQANQAQGSMKRNRRQATSKGGKREWEKHMLPLLFMTTVEGTFALAWSTSQAEG
ncbi:hypothetical protein CBR_g12361 [Chara braunii]|uniref:Uncharacterized protein n=1 Tax=Chara braunii TaxID=69332 RepID=A0A388KS79_CHABU|nr:hypothetical protein CBR_g12361 [Chara braunii]|eukprot:GBG72793.1 hypothetical protein CBR_g12361 [Chara braunii]